MKHVILVIFSFLLIGCKREGLTPAGVESNKYTIDNRRSDPVVTVYGIIILDDCEYIQFGADRSYGITHKGNCSNPIHCYNKIEQ